MQIRSFDKISVIKHGFWVFFLTALTARKLGIRSIHHDSNNLESKRPLTDGIWIVKNSFPSIISESQLCNNSFPLSVGADLMLAVGQIPPAGGCLC